jgi:hypothetical protein
MLNPISALLVAASASIWLGFFIERTLHQAAMYNLIGKGLKNGKSTKAVEKIVKKAFITTNWLYLALALFFASNTAYLQIREELPALTCLLFYVVALSFFLKGLTINLKAYEIADAEITGV